MANDFIIRNNRTFYQRESAAVEFACQPGIVKFIQPTGRVRIRAAFNRMGIFDKTGV